ncbi:MAG: type II toxin-antitoxin system HicA family toxin [Methanoregula sp.]|jgi:predicted RNA binding protein YcfA (HicA-like mRNA interferase family)
MTQVSWAELVRRLKMFDFDGPFQGGKHPYMIHGALVLTIPNPHRTEISVDLLVKILRQAGISREDWLMSE